MQGTSGVVPAAGGVRPVARVAWRGLVRVLFRSDPPARWRWRSPWQRWIAYTTLGTATLLCAASMAGQAVIQAHPLVSYTGPRFGYSSPQVTYYGPAVGLFTGGGWLHPPPWVPGGAITLWVLVTLGVVVVPIALAIRYPLLGWRIGWLALVLVPLLGLRWWDGLPWDPRQILVLLVVLCVAGVRLGRSALCWLWALSLVPWWFWIVHDDLSVVTAALGSVAFLIMGVAVDSVGSRQRAQAALEDQAEATEAERARRAVLEERARIARELHDVVAHHMSLMAIRAESAPHRLGALPDPVRTEFGWLSGSAREALADMRRLLGVLRSDQPAARTPQPGLPDLPGLVEEARQAGMTVDLSEPLAPGRVPPGAGVCAYRIVQEALSNAGRHAAGAPVTVSVRNDADAVTLQVINGPGAAAGSRANGRRAGHGLAGMRERVGLLGGSLSAGPAPDGGFAVSAVLPLSGSRS